MSAVEPGSATSGLVDRVKSILTKPSTTWDVIDGEPATVGGLYKGYVIPLAAIPAVCGLIGSVVFGYGAFGVVVKADPISAAVSQIVSYALSLAMIYVLALIIEALAPSFDGVKDRMQALKVSVYANTAAWVAGIFLIFPALSPLATIGGLYSLYLLYVGLPKLMKAPQQKALGYTVVTIIVAIVLSLVIGLVVGSVRTMGVLGGGMVAANAASSAGTVSVGGKTVDMGELEDYSKRVGAAAKQMEDGKGAPATDPEILKAYLPAAVVGYSRTELTASSGGAGGVNGSQAEGAYEKGDARMRVSVTDLGSLGALTGMAGAFNMQSSSESEGRYEKVGKVDGRMTVETFDSAAKHGEYSVLVGDRFMVKAEGDGVAMGDLKAAVGAIGVGKLESLAKS